jgi:acetyltransferase-like isoleucine patch superfamily enzyme
MTDEETFEERFLALIGNSANRFHPLVWIHGDPEIGEQTYIGRACDIASFVVINVADSHRRAIGLRAANHVADIVIGDNVFVGSMSVILGGAVIGHHSVIGAGTVVRAGEIPPYSLVCGNPMVVKPGYYSAKRDARPDA